MADASPTGTEGDCFEDLAHFVRTTLAVYRDEPAFLVAMYTAHLASVRGVPPSRIVVAAHDASGCAVHVDERATRAAQFMATHLLQFRKGHAVAPELERVTYEAALEGSRRALIDAGITVPAEAC